MSLRMVLVGLGALLLLGGLVLIAMRMIGAGPLSRAQQQGPMADATLEPRGRSGMFSARAYFPGIGLVAVGTVLMIAAASIEP